MQFPKVEILLPLVIQHLSKKFSLPPAQPEDFNLSWEDLSLKVATNPGVLTLLLGERCLRESLKDQNYGQDLLQLLIEELSPLKGYFFHFQGSKVPWAFTFLEIGPFHFYPLLFGDLQKLFLTLWQGDRDFRSFYGEITSLLSEADLKNEFNLISVLGFTRLTKKGRERLAPLLKLQKKLPSGGLIPEEGTKERTIYYLTSSSLIPEDLFRSVFFKEIGPEVYYVASIPSLEPLYYWIANREVSLGLVPLSLTKEEPFNHFSPLLLALASFEHAKRSGEKIKIADGFTLHVLGDLVYELEDLGFAKRIYELASPYTLQPVELALSLGSIYYTFGDYDRAEKVLRGKLCGCLREDPMVHHNLGLVYLAKENLEAAEYHLYKAHLLDPENELIRKTLIRFLFDQDKRDEVLDLLREQKNPHPEEQMILGKIYFKRGDYDKALAYLNQLLHRPERDGETNLYLAWLYLHLRKNPETAQIFLTEAKEKLSPSEYLSLAERLGLKI